MKGSWFAVEVEDGVWHSKYLNERELDERNPACQILGPFATIKDSLDAIEAETGPKQSDIDLGLFLLATKGMITNMEEVKQRAIKDEDWPEVVQADAYINGMRQALANFWEYMPEFYSKNL